MIDRRGGGGVGGREADPAAGEHPHRIAAGHSHNNLELGTLRQVDGLLELHDRDRRLVADDVPTVGLPRRVVVTVDEVRNRTVRNLFLQLLAVLRRWFRLHAFRTGEVGRGIHELERPPRLLAGLLCGDLEFLDAPRALAARAMHEEVAVHEGLELQARRPAQIGLRFEDHLLVPVAEHKDCLVGQLRRVREHVF